MCIRDRPQCETPNPSAARAMCQAPTADSDYGPRRPAAPGSTPARRTRARRPGWACRRAARMWCGHRGPR
eukprot:4647967-Alexandrium_andersonii.AAC.1